MQVVQSRPPGLMSVKAESVLSSIGVEASTAESFALLAISAAKNIAVWLQSIENHVQRDARVPPRTLIEAREAASRALEYRNTIAKLSTDIDAECSAVIQHHRLATEAAERSEDWMFQLEDFSDISRRGRTTRRPACIK